LGLLLGIVSNVLGGTTYVLGKIALEGWPPATLIALRLILSLPFLIATSPRGWIAKATRADWLRMIVIGTLGLAAPHLIGVYGLKDTDSINGAVLVGLEPVGIVILARIFLGERLRTKQALGAAAALGGAALVVSQGRLTEMISLDASARGSLLLAVQSVLWAVYTIAAKPTLERVPATALAAVSTEVAMLLIVPLSAFEWRGIDLSRALAPKPLLAAIALGLIVSYFATVLWNMSLSRIRANTMAILIFVQPITGMLLSTALGEPLHGSTLAGAALVFFGVWLSR
jgi:drug/metabolite transporter (DMT)-like permease